MNDLRWHKSPPSADPAMPTEWYAEDGGRIVARAAMTGTTRDNYPWSWWTEAPLVGATTGDTDTLRGARDAIGHAHGRTEAAVALVTAAWSKAAKADATLTPTDYARIAASVLIPKRG